jgi:hypothetical protein
MKSRWPEKTVLLLTALASAGTTLALGGGPFVREALLWSLLVSALGLVLAAIPILAFALLLRVIGSPLAVPEVRLVATRESSEVSAGMLEGRPAAI